MNILLLTPYLPYPLTTGGAQGMFNMIDHLRDKHKFTLVISENNDHNKENVSALQHIWPNVDIIFYPLSQQLLYWPYIYEKARRAFLRTFLPNSRKLLVERAVRPYGEWFSKRHIAFINEVISKKKIDLIQVEFYECLPWGNYLPSHITKIFIHHELGFVRKKRILQGITLTPKEQKQLEASKRKEFSDLEKYDAVLTVTDTDKTILEENGLRTPIYVSTLAINTSSYPYCVNPGNITFVGSYGHLPNKEGMEWFINEVTPLLNEEHLTLNLVGKSWPQSYTNCKNINVLLKGFVEDLHEVAKGSIMIVPILSGSGMRMKILEAAAMSLPFVTTTVGVEGLDFKDGESCLIADTPVEFAKAIKTLCNHATLRQTLGENANNIFRSKYHPSVLANQRDKIYNIVIKNK